MTAPIVSERDRLPLTADYFHPIVVRAMCDADLPPNGEGRGQLWERIAEGQS